MDAAPKRCPGCGNVGTRVDAMTLEALLTGDALMSGIPDAPRFCATADCPIVYFDGEALTTFTESDLTVRVHAKHPDDDSVQVCYCFDFTPARIEEEIRIRAYELFEQRGRHEGFHDEDWARAEAEVLAKYRRNKSA